MVSKMMWIGPRGNAFWLKAPAPGAAFTPVRWQSKAQQLNGGATITASLNSHMEYEMTWSTASRDALRPITDLWSGIYGPPPFYFIDPMAAEYNVVPKAWSFPGQATYDARPIVGDARPKRMKTPANTLLYPPESAQYTVTDDTISRKLYIPIPPGYAAWVGAHGDTSGPAVGVTPYVTGDVAVATVPLDMLTVTDDTRCSDSFDGGDYQGIELSIIPGDGSLALYPSPDLYPSSDLFPSSGIGQLVVLSGIIVQILPTGVLPARGGFISGQGSSGVKFEQAPAQIVYYTNIPGGEIGMSAKFVETEDSE